MDALAPGKELGKYRVVRRLATGGMAEIYLAEARGIEGFAKHVVLKCILPQYAASETFVRLFLNEARVTASLDHPNIASVYDIGEHEGTYFFAMEYLHGEDLGHLLRQLHGNPTIRLPLEHALTIGAGVAAGLHAAHEKRGVDGRPLGLVHRDVSPSNVFVTFDGGVKLVDFGVAKLTATAELTQTGTLKGKVAYMSPEQCNDHAARSAQRRLLAGHLAVRADHADAAVPRRLGSRHLAPGAGDSDPTAVVPGAGFPARAGGGPAACPGAQPRRSLRQRTRVADRARAGGAATRSGHLARGAGRLDRRFVRPARRSGLCPGRYPGQRPRSPDRPRCKQKPPGFTPRRRRWIAARVLAPLPGGDGGPGASDATPVPAVVAAPSKTFIAKSWPLVAIAVASAGLALLVRPARQAQPDPGASSLTPLAQAAAAPVAGATDRTDSRRRPQRHRPSHRRPAPPRRPRPSARSRRASHPWRCPRRIASAPPSRASKAPCSRCFARFGDPGEEAPEISIRFQADEDGQRRQRRAVPGGAAGDAAWHLHRRHRTRDRIWPSTQSGCVSYPRQRSARGDGSAAMTSRAKRAVGAAVSLAFLLLPRPDAARAADSAEAVSGDARTSAALSALRRVGPVGPAASAAAGSLPVSLAVGGGYGFTESVLGTGDRHHRWQGTLAAEWAALPAWHLGLRLAGRYDRHQLGADPASGTPAGHDDGWTGEPQLGARWGHDPRPGQPRGGGVANQPARGQGALDRAGRHRRRAGGRVGARPAATSSPSASPPSWATGSIARRARCHLRPACRRPIGSAWGSTPSMRC